jgi:hypothetical protein
MDVVLPLILVATAPRSDGLPSGVSHSITDRCSEDWPLVPAEDPGPGEELCDGFEFHPPWMRDFLDPVSGGGGDAQVSQHSTKLIVGDWSFSTNGFTLVSISILLLTPRCRSGESTPRLLRC